MALLRDLGMTSAMEGGNESRLEAMRSREGYPYHRSSFGWCPVDLGGARMEKKKKEPWSQGIHLALSEASDLRHYLQKKNSSSISRRRSVPHEQTQSWHWKLHGGVKACQWALKHWGNYGRIGRMEVRFWLGPRTIITKWALRTEDREGEGSIN